MSVTTDGKQVDEQAQGDDAPAAGRAPQDGLPPDDEFGPARDGGWRLAVATAAVWALALLAGVGRGLRRLARTLGAALGVAARACGRRWPVVREELLATPGELASIAARAVHEAASDVVSLLGGLREGLAWTTGVAVWTSKRTASFLRVRWPGARRRLFAAARTTVLVLVGAARLAGRALWAALLLAFTATRAGFRLVVRGASAVRAAWAARSARRAAPAPIAVEAASAHAAWAEVAQRPVAPELVAPWPAAAGRTTGPLRLAAKLGAVSVAVAGVALVFAAGGSAVARAVVAGITGSVRVHTGPLTLPPLAERSIVYAADGSVLAVLHTDDNRQPVTLGQVAPTLVDAVVDTEDAHFWQHGGVDPPAMVRALAKDVAAGRAQQGGSTIAQQLVKNTLLSPKRNVDRKIKEIVLADRVEHQLGKRGVLERYLNTVYFGQGAYGVEAAAETYFAEPASGLTPAQAALLAGLIQNPDGYDPVQDPAAARQRRQAVLGLMVAHHHLAPEVARAAGQEPLPVSFHRPPEGRDYFSDAVKQELLADRRLGATQPERYRALFAGGLRIRTTLDPALQRMAQAAIAGGLPHTDRHLTAALVAVDPGTGAVRALVGGPDFGQSQFNAALAGAGRQPGSSFKAFTLAAALQEGYSPADVLDGSTPCTIPNPGGTPDPWVPGNFEGEAFGPITLTDATAHSVNCAYARLAPTVGLRQIADVAHSMGITSHLNLVPSMTLGTNVVTPLQMAAAYSTLAADGVAHTAHLVEEVDGPDGKPIRKADGSGRRVLSSQVTREETQVLQQVVQSGTGQAAAVGGRAVAGKTGTAENYQDAWFVGYTPDLATAVWMGDPNGEVPMRDVEGINVVGGSFPARMWSAFMTQALADRPVLDFAPPDPAQIPSPTFLVTGQPRPATGTGGAPPPGQTFTTTWCMSSCGRGAPSGGSPPPPPGPGGDHHH